MNSWHLKLQIKRSINMKCWLC